MASEPPDDWGDDDPRTDDVDEDPAAALDDDDEDDEADIGGIGEDTLSLWCKQVGISPNPAKHDKKGFDNFLVLPKPRTGVDPSTPLDEAPPEFTCLVQAKTTYDANKPIRVKLSNWERFAKWPSPAFFFVLELDANREARRAFLVHVGEHWIARVLKRLRELPLSERRRLHKPRMDLTVSAEDQLRYLHGEDLLVELRKHTSNDPAAYAKAKLKLVEEVGYEDRHYLVRITFNDEPDEEFFERAAEFAIGLTDKMPLKRMRVRNVRFGIPALVKDVRAKDDHPVHMHIPDIPSRMNGVIEAAEIDGLESVRLNVKVYAAVTIFPFLPPKYRKIALKSEGMTMILVPKGPDPFTMGVRFRLPEHGDVRPMGETGAVAKFARLFFTKRVRLAFITNEKRSEFAEGQESIETTEFLDHARFIEDADLIMRRFQIPMDTKINFGRLGQQAEGLRMLASVIEPDRDSTGASAVFLADDEPTKVTKAAVMGAVSILIGEWAVLAVVAACGRPEWVLAENGETEMVIGQRPEIRFWRVFTIEEMKQIRVLPLIGRVVEELKKEGAEIVVGEPLDEPKATPLLR